MDEVQLKIKGTKHRLWWAVDQDGTVRDILVQERRTREATETFFRRLVGVAGCAPRVGVAAGPARRERTLYASVGMDADRDLEVVILAGEE